MCRPVSNSTRHTTCNKSQQLATSANMPCKRCNILTMMRPREGTPCIGILFVPKYPPRVMRAVRQQCLHGTLIIINPFRVGFTYYNWEQFIGFLTTVFPQVYCQNVDSDLKCHIYLVFLWKTINICDKLVQNEPCCYVNNKKIHSQLKPLLDCYYIVGRVTLSLAVFMKN